MRKLASVQRIISLSAIEGADKIEKAVVLGWEVVVKKGDFNAGDLCVYCEIDSILPSKPEFEFLRERKFRIKTIKLKGQVSQGICFPLDILPKKYHEGDDVTDVLGIKKYDPQAEYERKESERLGNIKRYRLIKFFMRYPWYRRLIFKPSKLPFPEWIKKTDEDRIQLFPGICEREKDTVFQVTEKLDGQSATYFVIKNPSWTKIFKPYLFGVCSRNFQILKPDGQSYWRVAKELDIKTKLLFVAERYNYESIVVQGEIIGSKIQDNKYSFKNNCLYVFNVYLNGTQCDYINSQLWANDVGLRHVPLLDENAHLPATISKVVEMAKGKSAIEGIPREGLVWRNYDKNISFKVVNPDFLLKYGE
jgi:hypothetical protein